MFNSIFPPTELHSEKEMEDSDWECISTLSYPVNATWSKEVTLIKVSQKEGKWVVGTLKKEDAFKSFWGERKSFGELFIEAVEAEEGSFERDLCPEWKYYFLLPTSGRNRIGALRDGVGIYLAGVEKEEGKLTTEECGQGFWKIIPSFVVENKEDAREHFFNGKEEGRDTGIMLFGPDKFIRVVYQEYWERYKLRRNESKLEKLYLELRKEHRDDDVKRLMGQHPNLGEFHRQFYDCVKRIHQEYMKRYVHRKFEMLSKRIHLVLRECHKEWLVQRKPTYQEDIENVMLNHFNSSFLADLVQDSTTQTHN